MRTAFKPLQTALMHWLRSTGLEGEIDDPTYLSRANDAVYEMTTDLQMAFKLAILDIKDYESELPPDFSFPTLVACLRDDTATVSVGKMVNWIYESPVGTDNDLLEINLITPECATRTCNYTNPIIEIETDKLFQRDNPDMFVRHWRHFHDAAKPIQDADGGAPALSMFPGFEIMEPFVHEDSFWNSAKYLKECEANKVPPIVGAKHYRLELPKMIVDFEEGQVLLAYMGYKMQDGYYMVPDIAPVYHAIDEYLTAFWLKRRWLKELSEKLRRSYLETEAKARIEIERTRSRLGTPSGDNWRATIQENFVVSKDEYFYR